MICKPKPPLFRILVIALFAFSARHALIAQEEKTNLPDAPRPETFALATDGQSSPAMPGARNEAPAVPSKAQVPALGPRLTLLDAEQMAIKNNPRVSMG